MNFFERQRQLRRLSARLVFLFLVAVAGIVVVVDLAVALAVGAFDLADPGQLATTLGFSSVSVVAAVGIAALFRTATLRGGGGRVARELGGRLVPSDTRDPQLRRLRNVVEEMAIAAGVGVPEIYVLPDEASINAFAAGWSTSDAAVAVTRGALDRLNRDELQGVIAHEFSHVVNGDMRLNIRLIGLLFGILFLSVIGRNIIFFGGGGRDRDGRNPLPLIGIALLVAGGIGVLVGRVIQASVSRQREYLADASAVQYTRQSSGLAGALKKIGGLPAGSQLRSPKKDEVGHMLFGPGAGLSSIFATHPPLADRIKALDPTFDPAELERLRRHWSGHPPVGLAEDAARGLVEPGAAQPAAARGQVDLPDPATRSAVDTGTVIGSVAEMPASAHDYAAALIAHIPEPVLERAHRIDTVVPLVLGLLMAEDPRARTVQHAELVRDHGQQLADAALREAEALAGLHPLLRLPLAELAFPALKARSEAERRSVLVAVSGLIHADNTITVYEYCVARLIYSQLYESMQPRPSRRSGRETAVARSSEVATLLAVLAATGTDEAAAGPAFDAGMAQILPGQTLPYAPPPTGVLALESGWQALDELRPEDKQRLVGAIVTTIGYDGTVSVTESELLRTVCALIRCPIPPLAVSPAPR